MGSDRGSNVKFSLTFCGFLCMVVVGWVVAMVVYLMGFLGGWLLVANLGLIFSYGFDFVLWV